MKVPADLVYKSLGITPEGTDKNHTARFNAAYEYAKHIVDLVRIGDLASQDKNYPLWHNVLDSIYRHVSVFLNEKNNNTCLELRAEVKDVMNQYVKYHAQVSKKQQVLSVHKNFTPPNPYDKLDEFNLLLMKMLYKADMLNPRKKDTTGLGIMG